MKDPFRSLPPTIAGITLLLSEIKTFDVMFEKTIRVYKRHESFAIKEGTKAIMHNEIIMNFYQQSATTRKLLTINHF